MYTLTLKITKPFIEHYTGYETASFWTDYKVLPGTYDLTLVKGDYRGAAYIANCDAEVVEDYFPSSFGGLQFGTYDSKQNAGRSAKRRVEVSIFDVLTDPRVLIDETEYDAVLELVRAELKKQIELVMLCLGDGIKPPNDAALRYNLDPMNSMAGHAAKLAELTGLYSRIHGVQGRRAYQKTKQPGEGWPASELRL